MTTIVRDGGQWDSRPKGSWIKAPVGSKEFTHTVGATISQASSAGGSGVCPPFRMHEHQVDRHSLSSHLREMANTLDDVGRIDADLVEQYKSKTNAAYNERNRLVAALARIFPSSLEHAEGASEAGWSWIVYVDLPTGQATWHIPDAELHLFDGITRCEGRKWDKHTTAEKYERVRELRDVKDLFPRNAPRVAPKPVAEPNDKLESLIRDWHAFTTEKPLSAAAHKPAADLVSEDYRSLTLQVRTLTKSCAQSQETLNTVLDQLGAPTGTDYAGAPALLAKRLAAPATSSERKELVKVMGLIMDDTYAASHQTFGSYRSALVKFIGNLLQDARASATPTEKRDVPHV